MSDFAVGVVLERVGREGESGSHVDGLSIDTVA